MTKVYGPSKPKLQPSTPTLEQNANSGMIYFHHRFIPSHAEVVASLTPLSGGPIEMSSEHEAAYERLKYCLAKATMLVVPSPTSTMEKVSIDGHSFSP